MRFSRQRVFLVLVLLVAACGAGSAGSLEQGLELNDDPESALLTITSAGGFVPVEFAVGTGPYLVLTRGGQLISQGPQIEIYPGPLLANWQIAPLDEESMLFVLEELDAIGFDEIDQVENNDATGVADAPTTTFRFYNQDGEHSFSVYALGIDENPSDSRVAILANLANHLGTLTSSSSESYVPQAIQVVAGVNAADVEDVVSNQREWPLPQSFAEMTDFGFEWRCAAYEGEQAEGLLDVFAEANQATRWTTDEGEYQILVRPLFPDEESCQPLV